MNAAISYSNQVHSNAVDSLRPVTIDTPVVQALTALPEDMNELSMYLHFVTHTVEHLAAEMYMLIDAVASDTSKYCSYIRGKAVEALIRHSASKPN